MTTPWTTSHQIKNFGKSFLDHPYYILSVSDICPRAEKIFFKEIHQFYTLPWGGGHEIYNSVPDSCYKPNSLKMSPSFEQT